MNDPSLDVVFDDLESLPRGLRVLVLGALGVIAIGALLLEIALNRMEKSDAK